jgi:RNA polymerase sigma factor (TIGR02999 family)
MFRLPSDLFAGCRVMSDQTHVFETIGRGDPRVANELLPLVYEELHRLAVCEMACEAPGNTLQPTALLHEAYLRLVGKGEKSLWDNPGHFFAAAAEAMRRILIEKARSKQCRKRGGDHSRQTLELTEVALPESSEDLLALDEALGKLKQSNPRLAELVNLRYFAGLTIKQAAQVIGVSARTADSDWSYARAWLLAEALSQRQRTVRCTVRTVCLAKPAQAEALEACFQAGSVHLLPKRPPMKLSGLVRPR